MHYILDLDIPRDEVLKFYAGAARQVSALTRQGLRVAFPAAVLRPFVTEDGVQGTFRLSVSAANRLQAFERVT